MREVSATLYKHFLCCPAAQTKYNRVSSALIRVQLDQYIPRQTGQKLSKIYKV